MNDQRSDLKSARYVMPTEEGPPSQSARLRRHSPPASGVAVGPRPGAQQAFGRTARPDGCRAPCLDGSRTWDPKAVDLGGFLRGVIRSLTSSEKKKAVAFQNGRQAGARPPRFCTPVDSPEDEAMEEENCQELSS